MNSLALQGILTSGLGEGAGFVALDWVDKQVSDKLGFAPYPGTLNLHLRGGDWDVVRDAMRTAQGIAIDPPPGFCSAKCFHVRIDDRIDGAVILPEVGDYPADKLEVIAPIAVRDALSLGDGDAVTLVLRLG